jgi:hypothetical protein
MDPSQMSSDGGDSFLIPKLPAADLVAHLSSGQPSAAALARLGGIGCMRCSASLTQ